MIDRTAKIKIIQLKDIVIALTEKMLEAINEQ